MSESLPELQERLARASAQIARIKQILGEDPPGEPESTSTLNRSPFSRNGPRFALQRGQGAWGLTFDWQQVAFFDRAGMPFVDYLLKHPRQSIHPLDLIAKVLDEAPLQQRAAALDDAAATKAHLHELERLRAIIDSDEASAAEKQEAEEGLDQAERSGAGVHHRTMDGAVKAARSVRQAIRRVCLSLAEAKDEQGRPYPALIAFATHLQKHLLDPSQPGLVPAGHLIYEPPPGISWI
jgi:hypothetical protein